MTAKDRTRISFRAINYHYAGAGLRSRIAWALRAVAGRIDHHESYGIRISTTPGLSRVDEAECITRGMAHSHRLIKEAVESQLIDNLMRKNLPTLYSEETR